YSIIIPFKSIIYCSLLPVTANCFILLFYSELLSLTTEAPRLYIPQYPVLPIQVMERIENHIITGTGPPWYTKPDTISLLQLCTMVGIQTDHNIIEMKD